MLGNYVNTAAIILGSVIGLLLKNGIKERYKNIVTHGVGLSVLFIGISSTVKGLNNDNAQPVLFIFSIVIGGLIGEKINIEKKLDNLGRWVQNKFKSFSSKDNNISQGFVTASLLFCVGTMAIIGSLESGINNNHNILFAKSLLDGVTSVILTSSLGIGVIFSSIIVFLYQGIIIIFASVIEPYLTTDIIREISIVGGILITSLGLNMLEIKKFKTGNLLPSILIPVIYYIFIIPLYNWIIMVMK